jgi:hypothetical protein
VHLALGYRTREAYARERLGMETWSGRSLWQTAQAADRPGLASKLLEEQAKECGSHA